VQHDLIIIAIAKNSSRLFYALIVSLAANAYAADPAPAPVAAENPDTVLQTVAEQSGYLETGRYGEVERLCPAYERGWSLSFVAADTDMIYLTDFTE
jgi:hypothetical protein